MQKIILISDIDDVVRDLKTEIIYCMNIFHKTNNWGEYYHANPKVSEFFKWFNEQSNYYEFFDRAKSNKDMINLYKKLLKSEKIELHFLSSNKNILAQEVTIDFIKRELPEIKCHNIHFVDSWSLKLDYVRDHTDLFGDDLTNIVFIDDMAKTCKMFNIGGINSFWYTKYLSDSVINGIYNDDPTIRKLIKGDEDDFKKFIYDKYKNNNYIRLGGN